MPPGHPDFGQAIPCRCIAVQRQQRRISALLEASNLGLLTRMTFDTFKPNGHGLNPHMQDNLRKAYEKARSYAANPQGWLVFRGSYGCGKTHLAAAIANEQVARGNSVLFVVVPDLLDYLRAAFAPSSSATFDQRFEALRTAPLLILDDLGAHSTTPWAQEKLFQILNYRYNAQLPTVITTNCELDMFDPRLRSRLMELEWSTMVQILAPDFRGTAVVEQSELSSLGLHKEQTFEAFDLREGDPALDAAQKSNLRRALATARAYAEEPTGWLVLTGGYGCGKTHLAAAIANQCVDSGNPAIFVVVPDLLDHLRAAFAPSSTVTFDRRFDEIRRAPMLVIDDLGSQSATPWAQEKLFQLFDHRYNAQLPTVITMTRDVDLDPRLKTRIMDTTRCRILEITAPSYRGEGRSNPPPKPRSTPSPSRGRRGLGVAR
ncbi:MAG TPA: ATP-binding protein [Anaerolineae bacterium]|nr:ATP-binding protein [Anaerolineae bacterium]HOU22627.1 ATP-binding protein [Anaerolineae bacterium]HQJ50753.1 ATP-binding protein [Anaerolineae bacterium]